MSVKILIAPNAFKGSLSAIDAATVIKNGLGSEKFSCEIAPIADGGDGTIDVLNFYFKKSKLVECNVHDSLMRPIESQWLLLDKETAVIELAKASGLTLLRESELNPMWASTFGTGELILAALNKGCKKIIITLGGSATVDAGLGILQALGAKIFDKKKNKLKAGGGILNSVQEINFDLLDKRLKEVKLDVLCDVGIPLLGEKGTVQTFAAQKGAKEGEIFVLEAGMKHFAEITKTITGNSYEMERMVGAAGGVAFSLKAFLNAQLFPGFLYLANLTSLEEKIKESDLVITGEGKLDSQTLMGKAVYELSKLAKKHGKKMVVFCGEYDEGIDWSRNGIDFIFKIRPDDVPLNESMINTRTFLENAVKNSSKLFINY